MKNGITVLKRVRKVFSLAIPLACLLLPSAGADGANLFRNPLFEEEDSRGRPAGWTLGGGGWDEVILTDQSFMGRKAFMGRSSKVEAAASRWSGIGQNVTVEPGKHELEFYTRVIGDGHITAHWGFFDREGSRISVPRYWTRSVRSTAEWTKVSAEIEVPEGASEMRFNFWYILDEGKQEGIVFLDAASLVNLDRKDLTGAVLPEGARLVLEENFSGGELPPGWEIISGEWRVEDNSLRGSERAIILYRPGAGSPNMRVEYTARAEGHPSDLSALVSIREPAPFARMNGYFFGFGSQFNAKNTIMRMSDGSSVLAERGGALEAFEDGIKPGERHRVVVERNHNELKFFIDGRLVLEGEDRFFGGIEGEKFGFYIWEDGYIDDIKVYALPWAGGGTVAERAVEYQRHEGFEGFAEGDSPAGFIIREGTAELRVVDRPTWIYTSPMGNDIVRDHCLEIKAGEEKGSFKLVFPFEHIESGIVEFDFLAEERGEIKFSVLGSGGEIINLVVSEDGRFMTEDDKGRRTLRDTVRYQRRVSDADFRFAENRWYTVRLQFSEGLMHIALLDLYSEIRGDFPMGDMGDYLPLSYEHGPMPGRAGAFAVSARGPLRAYLDNIIVFGPVGSDSVRGRPLTQSAAALLDMDFPPRKDPFSLKVQSYRHLTRENLRITPRLRAWDNAPRYRYFRDAGNAYNRLLVELAFIEERINMLRRSAGYVENPALRGRVDGVLAGLEGMYAEAGRLQEEALNAFAAAYLSRQDEKKLDGFYAAAEAAGKQHEEINRAVRGCLDLLKPVASAREIIAHPAPFGEGDIEWSVNNRRWERNGEPVVFDYFSHYQGGSFFWDDLKILGYQRYRDQGAALRAFPFREAYPPPEGKYTDPSGGNWRWLGNLREEGRMGLMRLKAGLNFAVTPAPRWWIEKYGGGDIFFTNPAGNAPADPSWRRMYMLDWWHPGVKKLIEEQFGETGRLAAEYKDAVTLIHSGWELKNTFPAGVAPGYSTSSVRAFRDALREKYQTVENLNRLWGTRYGGFGEISPPQGLTPPSGLQYEFRKFVHEGFSGWLGSITEALRKHAPEIPVASDTQYTLGGRLAAEAMDAVGYFRAVDIKLYHSYQAWDRKIVDRWHAQLGEATGTPWGTMEWLISQGCPYLFETDRMRNNGLREKSMQMMWGSTMPEFYGFGFGNWQYTTGIHEPRLDRMVFNYTAPFHSVYMERARRLGRPALTIPLAKPEIGLLETTSSYYNALGVREGMRAMAVELTESGWNFEFLYEQLLKENLQSLEGTDVLLIPSGLCMPDELSDIIYRWVEGGGVALAAGGPAGVMNEYGQPSGRLEEVFKAVWKQEGGRWELEGTAPFYSEGGTRAWKAEYGRGQAIVFNALTEHIFAILPDIVQKRFGSDNPEIQLCMREKDGVKYLYALNWSVYEDEEAEIFIKGGHRSVIDKGLQLPMQVPLREKDGNTYFRAKLAPAGLTLFRIQ